MWKFVPQPYCTGEEGVKMGVDRGQGNPVGFFTVSGHSVNWDEVIAWYLDGPGSSFKEGGVFVPGPTFRERVPRQRRHILKGIPFSKGVVTSHKPCSSFMNFFYGCNLSSLMGVPDATSIF